MPAWFVNLVIKLAISIGLPALIKKFPNWPSELWAILEEILKHVGGSADKPKAVADLKSKVRECTGAGCPVDTVK